MAERTSKRRDSSRTLYRPVHNNCNSVEDHEGDQFCAPKFRGDLLKTHMLYLEIGQEHMSEEIHGWIEDDITKLALGHFKSEEIDDSENRILLALTLGCANSTEEVLKVVDEVVRSSVLMTGLEAESDGGPHERQLTRVAMIVRNVANARPIPGAAAFEGAESQNPDTPWKHKAAACLLVSMVMDLYRSPGGYFARLLGGKSMVEIREEMMQQHFRAEALKEAEASKKQEKGEVEVLATPASKRKPTLPGDRQKRRKQHSVKSHSESGSEWSESGEPKKKRVRRAVSTKHERPKLSLISLLREADKALLIQEGGVVPAQVSSKIGETGVLVQAKAMAPNLADASGEEKPAGHMEATKVAEEKIGDQTQKAKAQEADENAAEMVASITPQKRDGELAKADQSDGLLTVAYLESEDDVIDPMESNGEKQSTAEGSEIPTTNISGLAGSDERSPGGKQGPQDEPASAPGNADGENLVETKHKLPHKNRRFGGGQAKGGKVEDAKKQHRKWGKGVEKRQATLGTGKVSQSKQETIESVPKKY